MGMFQTNHQQHGAGQGSHRRHNAQPLGDHGDLFPGHQDRGPDANSQQDIKDPAKDPEPFDICKLLFKKVLIKGIRQKNNRNAEGQVEAALGHIVHLAEIAGYNVKNTHAQGNNGCDFNKQ